jgi:phosphoribosylaminoimidazole-succinocarboxamide synthase
MNYKQYPLIYEGSVKRIFEIRKPESSKMGEAVFEFTDDSSVKDYGKLPFKTPFKGEDLCAMAVTGFQEIEKLGIPTIYQEQISEIAIRVQSVPVLDPDRVDLSRFPSNRLVPLETILRHVITPQSSARKRLASGALHPQALGLDSVPETYPYILPRMFFEGSTKLRNVDEYLSWEALKSMSKESVEVLNQIEIYARSIGLYALRKGGSLGLIINDFKLEWALNEAGEPILADIPLAIDEITSAYTGRPFQSLDEFRQGYSLFLPGIHHDPKGLVNLSKQIYRDHYLAAEPEWIFELERSQARKADPSDYPDAPEVPEPLIDFASQFFGGLRNLWCSGNSRPVRALPETIMRYKEWASSYYLEAQK